jgi:predicted TIM-barrel fold metal-dependent hydrolase
MTVIDFHTHSRLSVGDLGPWIAYTRRCGIDRIVLLGDVLGHGYNPDAAQVREINDGTFALVRKHRELCDGFCFLNPTLESRSCLEELDRCRSLGARGVKMEVSAFASDERLDPIMRRLGELGLPLLHHSWNTRSMGKLAVPGCHQSDPEDIAILAARFPRVPIIAAHLRPDGLRGIWEVRECPNVSFDTSGGQPITGVIEAAVRLLGAERVLFGSDAYFPVGRDYSAQKACLEAARLSDRARERILGLNALRLLGERDR